MDVLPSPGVDRLSTGTQTDESCINDLLDHSFVYSVENDIKTESEESDLYWIPESDNEEQNNMHHDINPAKDRKFIVFEFCLDNCEILDHWSRSISNHTYWCKGNGELVFQKWCSILNHFLMFLKDMVTSSQDLNIRILKIVSGLRKVLVASTRLERHIFKLVLNTFGLTL